MKKQKRNPELQNTFSNEEKKKLTEVSRMAVQGAASNNVDKILNEAFRLAQQ